MNTPQPTQQVRSGGRLGISGALEFRDVDGNLLKTIQMTGSVPLDELGITQEQAAELVAQQPQSTR